MAWEAAYEAGVKQLAQNILGDNTHPLHKELAFLPSGCRLRQKEKGAHQEVWGIVHPMLNQHVQ